MVVVQGLKQKMLSFCSILNPCKNGGSMKGEDGEEEAKMDVAEKIAVHQRGFRMGIWRGLRGPGVSKGQPPQTS